MGEKLDITEHATAAGWTLPEGFTVLAWYEPDDIEDPREKGEVYNTDVDEVGDCIPTKAFCKHCNSWIHQLTTDDEVSRATEITRATVAKLDREYVGATPGLWSDAATGVICPARDWLLAHEPNEPLAVRWWREDRWAFVGVRVEVVDAGGRQWGSADLWSVEVGTFPHKIDAETGAVESVELSPLRDGSYPVPDLIAEALHVAGVALAAHEALTLRVIVAPFEYQVGDVIPAARLPFPVGAGPVDGTVVRTFTNNMGGGYVVSCPGSGMANESMSFGVDSLRPADQP